jgi:hypothetical protein
MIGENRPAARLLKTFSDDATFTVSQGEIEAVVPIRAQAASVMIPSGS